MVKYRTSIAITLSMLETIYKNDGASISMISMHANIPHIRLKEKVNELISNGLIVQNSSSRSRKKKYLLTEKGKKAYFRLRELLPFLSSLGLISKDD